MAERTDDPAVMPTADDTTGELTEVFGTEDEAEAQVVKSLLESAGIAALITSLEAQQSILPGVGGVVVRVRGDQAEDARLLIEQARGSSLSEDGDTSGTPPAA